MISPFKKSNSGGAKTVVPRSNKKEDFSGIIHERYTSITKISEFSIVDPDLNTTSSPNHIKKKRIFIP